VLLAEENFCADVAVKGRTTKMFDRLAKVYSGKSGLSFARIWTCH
jgi:hypothetical protein